MGADCRLSSRVNFAVCGFARVIHCSSLFFGSCSVCATLRIRVLAWSIRRKGRDRNRKKEWEMANRSFSLSTLAQYAFLAVIGYVLAGAPLSSILFSGSKDGSGRKSVGKMRGQGVKISREKLESLVVPEANLSCAEHRYRGMHVLSRDPLVVYIEGFLGEGEIDEVVELR